MKICFSPEQFFDNEGVVLAAGRISIYYAGTDNLVPLYHFQANEYVSAENPVEISDSGRIDSVFFDSAIVSVKVEKRLDDDTFEQVTAYEYGIDVPGGKSDTVVTGISALKEASPTLGAVTVVGYRNQYDVGPRTYVWDPNAIDQPDDGCVVASSVEVTGRWLLLWNDEILPAGIYGVTPGHIENMAALMSRPRIYGGSYSIVAPGTTGFPGGNFASSNSYTTTYDLMLDRATRFGDATITAPKIDVSGLATEAEANFQIRKPEGVGNPLKLSLVKSRTQVGATNADVIIVDKDNTSGSAQITLYNKLVYAYIDIPSWLTFADSIVLHQSTGLVKGKTVQASGVLKVGNLFRIVPHEDVYDRYYDVYSQGNDDYPTMRIGDDQNVIFMNGIDVRSGISIPRAGHTQQWWGYFEGDDDPQIQIDAEGSIKCTTLQGNLTSTNASIDTLTVTSQARVDKLTGRNYNFIPLLAGLNRSYTDVTLNWTGYGSHILPTSIPQNARIKIYMKWAWEDSSSVPISDYLHLSGASGRSYGDCIAIQNCGPQGADFVFTDMYRDHDAKKIVDHAGPIFIVDMNLNLIDTIPPFETHNFMYNGSGWTKIEV